MLVMVERVGKVVYSNGGEPGGGVSGSQDSGGAEQFREKEDMNMEGRARGGYGTAVGEIMEGGGGLDGCSRYSISTTWLNIPDTVAQASIVSDLNLLKQNIKNLQVRVHELESCSLKRASSDLTDTCHIYVRSYQLTIKALSNESLSRIAGCNVLWFTCIKRYPFLALKVKIPKSGLHKAVTSNATGLYTLCTIVVYMLECQTLVLSRLTLPPQANSHLVPHK